MTVSALVSSSVLVDLIPVVPDYRQYGDMRRANDLESPYRLAVGRILKEWGDRLLDIAEQEPSTLSRGQTAMIDALLESIGEIFRALNAPGSLPYQPAPDTDWMALQTCDASLMRLIESTQKIKAALRQREYSAMWLERHAKPLQRTLRRMVRELDQRNEILGILPRRELEDRAVELLPGGLA